MKLFTQIALVSAIAASSSAMALTALDETQLSNTTGQDGITILLAQQQGNVDAVLASYGATGYAAGSFSTVTVGAGNSFGFSGLAANDGIAGITTIDRVIVHDKDGYTNTALFTGAGANGVAGVEGALVIDGVLIANSDALRVDLDINGSGGQTGTTASAGGAPAAGTNAYLNVKLTLPKKTLIHVGDISVAKSNRSTTATGINVRGIDAAASKIKVLDGLDIVIGDGTTSSSLNIQLGSEAQGAMIVASGKIVGGLTINKLTLRDKAGVDGNYDADTNTFPATGATLGRGQGALYVGSININGAGTYDATTGAYTASATGLSADATIDISKNGLIVRTTSADKMDIMLADVRLGFIDDARNLATTGTAKSLGDIEIAGLNGFGTAIAISGH